MRGRLGVIVDTLRAERSLVLQQWLWAQGFDRAALIGAAAEAGAVSAHARLEGEDSGGHFELTRLEGPNRGRVCGGGP